MHGNTLNDADSVKDLGIMRSSDGSYSEHCHMIVRKAAKMEGAISLYRHVFRCKRRELMWTAFKTYINPILMYCSPA